MTLDDFTTAALALCAAAGQPDLDLLVSMTRRRTGDEYYLGTAAEAGFSWDVKQVAASCRATAELALADFAGQLGVSYPLPPTAYATADQKQTLIKLFNCQWATGAEKTRLLLRLPALTETTAADLITEWRAKFAERAAQHSPFLVRGSAELVQPAQVAA